MDMTRRGFVDKAAMAAAGLVMGRRLSAADGTDATTCVPQKDPFIWAALLHMGTNMWCDHLVTRRDWGMFKGEQVKQLCAADHVRFDEAVWRTLTGRMAEVGMNMVVIDLGEAIQYPSHKELWVKGSWEIDRFRKELARLRAMGLEPIPKMNFSTTHDAWLKDYHHMVSSRPYYQVCADLIRDVAGIFDHPRFLHLGYDEEIEELQKRHEYCIVRHGDLWWRDFLWFVKETEKAGMRPWMWSDYAWRHPHFYARCPKSVLQSNFYYGSEFNVDKLKEKGASERTITMVNTYEELDKAGFDQIPTGSNCYSSDDNFTGTVKHCRKVCSPERLKGFMMAPWFFTLKEWEKKDLEAIDQVGAVIKEG